MQLIRDLSYFTAEQKGLSRIEQPKRLINNGHAVTIGNFDGIHIGHQAILSQLKERAIALDLVSLVLCFEPQPLEYFLHKEAPARLSSFSDKFRHFSKIGIDRLFCVRFNQDFAQMSAIEFIENILIKKLQTKLLVVGDDFTFGANREGNFELLAQSAKKFNFELISSHSLLLNEQRVSSTQIRILLAKGDFESANQCLGYPYHLVGRVCHGKKLGRLLGFPTANILLKRRVLPLAGVFVVRVNSVTLKNVVGVANIGIRPTLLGTKPQMEVHLFNCDQHLYQQRLQVDILHKLRNEKKFANVDQLKEQISRDVDAAKIYLTSNERT